MKIAVSYLSVIDNLEEFILKINQTNADYIHVDVMDGSFVPKKTLDIDTLKSSLINTKKPFDVHLMVNDIYKYIDWYKDLNPDFITFHYEAANNIEDIISYIRKYNIKVGISINPETNIDVLNPYLDMIDLVLIMSVNPGLGGQKFIDFSINKINNLKNLNKNILIEVDGGINNLNIQNLNCDIAVVGSFITSEDNYQKQIDLLK